MKVVLTIAGSDSGGGAGIQADLKTFEAHSVFGACVITGVTAQNTLGVRGVWDLPPEAVREQIEAVFDDFPVAAIKIGMLSTAEIVSVVADALERRSESIPLVLDPVLAATGGEPLLEEDAVRTVGERLVPLATLVTPNCAEAEVLCRLSVDSVEGMRDAARTLVERGANAVLIKGGDRDERNDDGERIALDLLFDGVRFIPLEGEFIRSTNTHGTGCTFSSAIAANLANGYELFESVERAKRYVTEAIRRAPGLGSGHGPLLHGIEPF